MKTLILTVMLLGSSLSFEVAETPSQHAKGMMFRDSWGDIDGMLFIFDQAQRVSFWMKNTSIAMALLYIDYQYRIVEVHRGIPFSLEPMTSSNDQVQYVLETSREHAQRILQHKQEFSVALSNSLQSMFP